MDKHSDLVISSLKTFYRKMRSLFWLFRAKEKGPFLKKTELTAPILFLLPEVGINLYVKTLVSVASQLKLQGHQILFARCFNIFERCMFMNSQNLPLNATLREKKFLCTYCFRSFNENIVKNNFEFIDLRHFSLEEDKREIQKLIDETSNGTFEFSFEGINFSGILEYNLFLYLKKSEISNLSVDEIKLWKEELISLFVGYKAVKRLIKEYGISHIVMSEQYSFNSIIKELANNMGSSLVSVTMPFHKDIDISKLRIMQKDPITEIYEALQDWPRFKNLAVSPNLIKEIVDDLIIRMQSRGTYTYSPKKSLNSNITDYLKINKNKKIIVAYPSSPDEAEAILKSYSKRGIKLNLAEDAFVDQFEWLDELIAFTEDSTEFQLIIRLHPRMAANHREKWGCLVAGDFIERYSKSYRNVRMIWPEEKISSFDLAEIADVVSVSWSSMGIFMARLGIPVVTGLQSFLPALDNEIYSCNKTKKEFFTNLQIMANKTPSHDAIIEAYRWYHLFYLSYTIDLSDIITEGNRKIDVLSKNAKILKSALIENQSVLETTLDSLKSNQSLSCKEEENKELFKQYYRLIHFFMTNKDDLEDNAFSVEGLNVQAKEIEYLYQGIKYEKYSPLVARIACMLKESPNISVVGNNVSCVNTVMPKMREST